MTLKSRSRSKLFGMVGEGDEMYHWCELGDNRFYGYGDIACYDFSGTAAPPWRHLPARPIGVFLLGKYWASNTTLHKKFRDAVLLSFFATAGLVKNTYSVVT